MEARILARACGLGEIAVLLFIVMGGCGAIIGAVEYEAGPIVRGDSWAEFLHGIPFCVCERLSRGLMCSQVFVEVCHDHQRIFVVNGPQSGNDCFRTSEEKRPGECRNTLFAFQESDRRIASRQDD